MPRKAPSPYDHHWRKLQRFVLERDGYRCYFDGCEERATEADHIIPVSEAPHLRLDPDNVRASCRSHNAGRVWNRLHQLATVNRSAGKVRDW